MKRRWTEEEIWSWYDKKPWITGVNFIPSTTINNVEFWQKYEHDRVFCDVGKELWLAQSLGYNSLRVGFPFDVWQQQPEVFFTHLDEFLSLCDSFGMTIMPRLFGDCCSPKSQYREIQFGKQPDPVKGYFGGSTISPFDSTENVGWLPIDEPGMEPVVEKYIRKLAKRYGQDPRILIWNIWNEPGNSNRGNKSLPMMTKVYEWLRDEDVSQPLTTDVFAAMPGCIFPDDYMVDPRIESEIELAAIALSDIITFHYYGDYPHMKRYIGRIREYNRPLICDEWLHRPMHNFIHDTLPLFKRERIGSYMFGFVNGKRQFNEPWQYLRVRTDMDFTLWMHDIFHSNFMPYDPEEIEVIKRCNLTK